MSFNKEEYWKRRHNTVEVEQEDENGKKVKVQVPKPLRGQGDKPPKSVAMPDENSKATIGFDLNGQMVVKNRAFRRQRVKLPGDNHYTTKQLTKAERKVQRKKGRK